MSLERELVGPDGDEPVIQLDGVSYRYPRARRDVVRDMSWSVTAGRVAVLGPNGAGKSTMLQLVAGLRRPRAGTVTVSGDKVDRRSRLGSTVGYLPQDVPVIPGMSVREQTRYHLWLSGASASSRGSKAVDEALVKVRLEHLGEARAASLSGGERRRLGIACAIVHQPSVLLMDEPLAGLDPLERESVDEVLATALSARTVVVTTHQTESLSTAFDSVAIVAAGAVIEHRPVAWYLEQPCVEPGREWVSIYRHYVERAAA